MFATEIGTAQSFCQRHPDICAMLYREFVASGGGSGADTENEIGGIEPTPPPYGGGGGGGYGGSGGGGGVGTGGGGTASGGGVGSTDETGELDQTWTKGGHQTPEYNSEQSEALRRVMMELTREERAQIIRNFVAGSAYNRAGTSPTVAIAGGSLPSFAIR